jgi:hypothetical protein
VKISGLLLAVVLLIVVLCACDRVPEFPVPDQRPPVAPAPMPGTRIVNMDDPGAQTLFVRDISPVLASNWRWGFQRPAVRILVRTAEHQKYTIDLALPEITFKDTGPVTITFTVNDRVLDRVHYTTAGSHHFEKPVPAAWLDAGRDAILGAEVDRMWVAGDGSRFGFILTRIGLIDE